ncbi:hypothetical protein PR048_027892 [Dryococelus australis]|uniref:Uncharacterized protein n=1 Tax=Dryococelus australis TaxID=614101 RepID=A0ABQ9GHQ2_9NEOP|nr:hypothetical protein PR048_027892 [Dryococelus australis]
MREVKWVWGTIGMGGRGKRENPDKTRRSAASSGTIPRYEKSWSGPTGNRARKGLMRPAHLNKLIDDDPDQLREKMYRLRRYRPQLSAFLDNIDERMFGAAKLCILRRRQQNKIRNSPFLVGFQVDMVSKTVLEPEYSTWITFHFLLPARTCVNNLRLPRLFSAWAFKRRNQRTLSESKLMTAGERGVVPSSSTEKGCKKKKSCQAIHHPPRRCDVQSLPHVKSVIRHYPTHSCVPLNLFHMLTHARGGEVILCEGRPAELLSAGPFYRSGWELYAPSTSKAVSELSMREVYNFGYLYTCILHTCSIYDVTSIDRYAQVCTSVTGRKYVWHASENSLTSNINSAIGWAISFKEPKQDGAALECKGGGNGRTPRKPHWQVASSSTIPTCKIPGVNPPGIQPGSPWWSQYKYISCKTTRAVFVIDLKKCMFTCIHELQQGGHSTAENPKIYEKSDKEGYGDLGNCEEAITSTGGCTHLPACEACKCVRPSVLAIACAPGSDNKHGGAAPIYLHVKPVNVCGPPCLLLLVPQEAITSTAGCTHLPACEACKCVRSSVLAIACAPGSSVAQICPIPVVRHVVSGHNLVGCHDAGKREVDPLFAAPGDVAEMRKTGLGLFNPEASMIHTLRSLHSLQSAQHQGCPVALLNSHTSNLTPYDLRLPGVAWDRNKTRKKVKVGENGASPECKGECNGRSPRKTRRPAASSSTIPSCGNLGVTRSAIEPGSPWWAARSLTAQPPRPQWGWMSTREKPPKTNLWNRRQEWNPERHKNGTPSSLLVVENQGTLRVVSFNVGLMSEPGSAFFFFESGLVKRWRWRGSPDGEECWSKAVTSQDLFPPPRVTLPSLAIRPPSLLSSLALFRRQPGCPHSYTAQHRRYITHHEQKTAKGTSTEINFSCFLLELAISYEETREVRGFILGQAKIQHICRLDRTVFDTSWRTLAQSSPSTVAADKQWAVDIGIFAHNTVESYTAGPSPTSDATSWCIYSSLRLSAEPRAQFLAKAIWLCAGAKSVEDDGERGVSGVNGREGGLEVTAVMPRIDSVSPLDILRRVIRLFRLGFAGSTAAPLLDSLPSELLQLLGRNTYQPIEPIRATNHTNRSNKTIILAGQPTNLTIDRHDLTTIQTHHTSWPTKTHTNRPDQLTIKINHKIDNQDQLDHTSRPYQLALPTHLKRNLKNQTSKLHPDNQTPKITPRNETSKRNLENKPHRSSRSNRRTNRQNRPIGKTNGQDQLIMPIRPTDEHDRPTRPLARLGRAFTRNTDLRKVTTGQLPVPVRGGGLHSKGEPPLPPVRRKLPLFWTNRGAWLSVAHKVARAGLAASGRTGEGVVEENLHPAAREAVKAAGLYGLRDVSCRRRNFSGLLSLSENGAQRRNARAGETGDSREYPPTSGIFRQNSNLRKFSMTRPGIEPGSPWWEARSLTASPPQDDLSEEIRVNGCECGETPECKGGGNGRSLRKSADLRLSSGMFPTCENPGATPPGSDGQQRGEAKGKEDGLVEFRDDRECLVSCRETHDGPATLVCEVDTRSLRPLDQRRARPPPLRSSKGEASGEACLGYFLPPIAVETCSGTAVSARRGVDRQLFTCAYYSRRMALNFAFARSAQRVLFANRDCAHDVPTVLSAFIKHRRYVVVYSTDSVIEFSPMVKMLVGMRELPFVQGDTMKEHTEICKDSSTGSQQVLPATPFAASMGTDSTVDELKINEDAENTGYLFPEAPNELVDRLRHLIDLQKRGDLTHMYEMSSIISKLEDRGYSAR